MKNYLKLGTWNAVCDRCGFYFKADQLKKEWTDLMVCEGCFETKHPQLMIRVPKEEIAPPWVRPEPTDSFLSEPDYGLNFTADPNGGLIGVGNITVVMTATTSPTAIARSSLVTRFVWTFTVTTGAVTAVPAITSPVTSEAPTITFVFNANSASDPTFITVTCDMYSGSLLLDTVTRTNYIGFATPP